MERQRRRRPGKAARCGMRVQAALRRGGRAVRAFATAVRGRCRPWAPTVQVDARRGRARRLRRALRRATRAHVRALGVLPPQHLLIVVQRSVVSEEGALTSLLQVFEDPTGVRRHVLFLALSVGDEPVTDGAVVAQLRQQLHEVVGEALGPLVASVGKTPAHRRAEPVPLHPLAVQPSAPGDEPPPPSEWWEPAVDSVAAGQR